MYFQNKLSNNTTLRRLYMLFCVRYHLTVGNKCSYLILSYLNLNLLRTKTSWFLDKSGQIFWEWILLLINPTRLKIRGLARGSQKFFWLADPHPAKWRESGFETLLRWKFWVNGVPLRYRTICGRANSPTLSNRTFRWKIFKMNVKNWSLSDSGLHTE